jgi:hypothetical protein
MNAKEAAGKLNEKLRKYSWFIAVGAGLTDSGETLYVYVRSPRRHPITEIGESWMGLPIEIRVVGEIRVIRS